GGAVIQVPGLDAGPEIGTAIVGRGTVGITASGLAVGVGMGTPAVVMVITPGGLAVGVGMGDANVLMVITPGGLAVGVGMGAPVVGRGTVAIAPTGLAVAA